MCDSLNFGVHFCCVKEMSAEEILNTNEIFIFILME